jgi:hypothetical protein
VSTSPRLSGGGDGSVTARTDEDGGDEALAGDGDIPGGGRRRGVAEQLLDGVHVAVAGVGLAGEPVPQSVRGPGAAEPDPPDAVGDGAGGEVAVLAGEQVPLAMPVSCW